MRYVKLSPHEQRLRREREWVWGEASRLQAELGLTRDEAIKRARKSYFAKLNALGVLKGRGTGKGRKGRGGTGAG